MKKLILSMVPPCRGHGSLVYKRTYTPLLKSCSLPDILVAHLITLHEIIPALTDALDNRTRTKRFPIEVDILDNSAP